MRFERPKFAPRNDYATRHDRTGTAVASFVGVKKHEPHATFLDGRYRLDRLVVAHDDVIIWDATDLAHGRSVQLSVFERGSSVLHQGTIGSGMFVAVDAASNAPKLELAEDEDAFERERPRRQRRAWPWAVAGLACALVAGAGWYVASSRSRPVVSDTTTITAAPLPAAELPTIPTPIIVVQPPPEPTHVVEAPAIAQPPQHRVKPAPLPTLQRPKPTTKPHTSPTNYDPLTL